MSVSFPAWSDFIGIDHESLGPKLSEIQGELLAKYNIHIVGDASVEADTAA